MVARHSRYNTGNKTVDAFKEGEGVNKIILKHYVIYSLL